MESKAIVNHNDRMENITIKPKKKSDYRFDITNWIDKNYKNYNKKL